MARIPTRARPWASEVCKAKLSAALKTPPYLHPSMIDPSVVQFSLRPPAEHLTGTKPPTMGDAPAPSLFKRLKSRKANGFPWRKLTFAFTFTFTAPSWRWKRLHRLPLSLLDRIVFHILYALESVVLVAACSLFVCCCGGCHL